MNVKRKTWFAAVGLTAILALTACSNATSNNSDNGPSSDESAGVVAIQERGVLRVGIDVASANRPFESFSSDGVTPEGLDIDLATAIADELGVAVEIQDIGFDSLLSALDADRIDVVMSGMGVFPERIERADFVDYTRGGYGILTRVGEPVDGDDVAGLCGGSVALLDGTSIIDELEEQRARCQSEGADLAVSTFATFTDAILALKSERVDAVVDAFAPMSLQAESLPELDAVPITESQLIPVFNTGLATSKGTGLAEAIASSLANLEASGTYLELLKKWGIASLAVEDFALNKPLT